MITDLSQVYMIEGLRNFRRRKIKSALSYLNKSVLLDSNNWEAVNLSGLCHYTMGDFSEAKNLWNKSINTNSREENRAKTYLRSLEETDFKAVCNFYNEALKYSKEGQFKKADRILDSEALAKCDIVPFINLKGLCKLAVGKKSDAVRLWRQALYINNEDVSAVNYIADTLESKSKGSTFYNFVVKIFGTNKEIRKGD